MSQYASLFTAEQRDAINTAEPSVLAEDELNVWQTL